MAIDVGKVMADWLKMNQPRLPDSGVAVQLRLGNPDWTPHSAWIDFETKHSIGQIRAWDRGDVDVELGFLDTSEIRPPVYREIAMASELESILDATLQEAIDGDRLRTLLLGIVAGDKSMATTRELEEVLATGFSNDGRFEDLELALAAFHTGGGSTPIDETAWLAPAARPLPPWHYQLHERLRRAYGSRIGVAPNS